MCGIVGFTGKQKAAPVLLDGLSKLEVNDDVKNSMEKNTYSTHAEAFAAAAKAMIDCAHKAQPIRFGIIGVGNMGTSHIKMNVDGKIVNIEIQVNRETYFKERTLFYWSKLYSDELGSGDDYGKLKQTICINIINFNLFDCEEYHSHFKILENDRGEQLTDKFAIHFFELKKVNKSQKSSRQEDWLKLIDAETEGDLMAIQQTTNIPEVQDTIVMIRQLSADEKVQQEAYYREKQIRDEISALNGARREGEILANNATAERMRKAGFTEEQIKIALGENYS